MSFKELKNDLSLTHKVEVEAKRFETDQHEDTRPPLFFFFKYKEHNVPFFRTTFPPPNLSRRAVPCPAHPNLQGKTGSTSVLVISATIHTLREGQEGKIGGRRDS